MVCVLPRNGFVAPRRSVGDDVHLGKDLIVLADGMQSIIEQLRVVDARGGLIGAVAEWARHGTFVALHFVIGNFCPSVAAVGAIVIVIPMKIGHWFVPLGVVGYIDCGGRYVSDRHRIDDVCFGLSRVRDGGGGVGGAQVVFELNDGAGHFAAAPEDLIGVMHQQDIGIGVR